MNECKFLSDDELNALIAQGWQKMAGPFDNEADCLVNCGGSSGSSSSSSGISNIFVACCTNGIPSVLHATLANVFACACVNGIITLVYDGVSAWTGTGSTGSGCTGGPFSITLSFSCTGTDCTKFALTVSGCTSTTLSTPDSCSCSPFHIVWTVGLPGGCGCTSFSNAFTVTVTA